MMIYKISAGEENGVPHRIITEPSGSLSNSITRDLEFHFLSNPPSSETQI